MSNIRADTPLPAPVGLDVHHRPRHRAHAVGVHDRRPERRPDAIAGRRDLEPHVLPPDRRLRRPRPPGHGLRQPPDRGAAEADRGRRRAAAGRGPVPRPGQRGRQREQPHRGRQGPGVRRCSPRSRRRCAPPCSRSSRTSSRGLHQAFSLAVSEVFLIGVGTTVAALVAVRVHAPSCRSARRFGNPRATAPENDVDLDATSTSPAGEQPPSRRPTDRSLAPSLTFDGPVRPSGWPGRSARSPALPSRP